MHPIRLLICLCLAWPGWGLAQPTPALHFERIDSGDGLSHNSVFAILQDRQGYLWFGTQDGLNRYDGYEFRIYRHTPEDATTLSANAVLALAEGPQGDLWVGTRNALNHFDPVAHTFRAFRPHSGPFAVIDVALDEAGGVWTVSVPDSIVHRFDPSMNAFVQHPARAYPRPSPRRPRSRWPPLEAPVEVELEDSAGRLWVGTRVGLFQFDDAGHRFVEQVLDPEQTSYIARYVRALYQDRAGTLWVGTLSGLYRQDPNVNPFLHLRPGDLLPAPGPQSPVMALDQDAQGQVWVGTLGAGLMRVDPDRQTARHFPLPHPNQQTAANTVWAVHAGSAGRIWVGTSVGLAAFDPVTARFTWYPLESTGRMDVSVIVPGLVPGTLIVGGVGGLYQIEEATQSVRLLIDGAGLGMPAETWMDYLWVDQDRQRVGVLAAHQGLVWYDPQTVRVTVASDTLNVSLQRAQGWGVYPGRAEALWIPTENGLRVLDQRTGTVTAYPAPPEMPGAIVYSLLPESGEDRFWLGTNHGLARFDTESGQFQHYTVPGEVEYNRRAALQLADGRMVFGGLNGLTLFRPEAIRGNPYRPPVVITQVEYTSQSGTPTLRPPPVEPLVLKPGENAVGLTYAALNFTQSHKNQYRYRLQGLEQHWHEAGTRRRVDYANLPPGRYTFEVQGSNNDGLWSEATAKLALVVLPPFWQTGWFRVLLLALMGGLLYAAYRYRVRRLLEVERMRLRIAGDLHDDIGSKLSGMALMSELLETDPSLSEAARADLQELGTSTREIIRDLRDIVWFIDPEHDRAGKTVEKMQQATRSLLSGMPYTFDTVNAAHLEQAPMAFRRTLYLIYKEALNNIVRHAHAAEVTIVLAVSPPHVRLSIQDTGAGFDVEQATEGSGLKNMHRRAREINGTLTLTSTPGAGTTLTLTAPLP